MDKNSVEELQLDKNSVSLAGEFAVLSQLALRGFNANMTLGKTKGVDIIGYCDNVRMFKLEVKTKQGDDKIKSSKIFGKYSFSWPMDEKHEILARDDLFYCFVKIVKIEKTYKLHYYIVPSQEVANYVTEQHKYWLESNKKHNATKMREFRLGIEKEKGEYPIKTVIDTECEDKWDLLKQSEK